MKHPARSSSSSLLLAFLTMTFSLLLQPTDAVPISIEIVDDANSCTAMKLTESNMQITCNDSTDCQAGDTASITGNLLIHNTISGNPTVILRPCVSVMGIVMSSMCSDPIEAGYLCDWYNYDYNGGECGAMGSGFTIENSVTVPQEAEQIEEIKKKAFGFLPGVGVTVQVSFDNESCGYQTTSDSGATSMAYAGAAGAVVVFGAYSMFERRRRRIGTDDGSDDNGQRFIEMKDAPGVTVV